MNISRNIKKRRLELGISQEELAYALGYKSRSTIAKLESGINDIPLSKLLKLANTLDISLENLLTGVLLPNYHNEANGISRDKQRGRRNVAIILAGGKSTRNRQNIPNQFINVQGKPIIVYCMEVYQSHPLIDDIYIVCLDEWKDILAAYIQEYKITKTRGIVKPGRNGILSILNGVRLLLEKGYRDKDVVIFQESTRPFITEEMISKLFYSCEKNGSAITCKSKEDSIQFLINGDITTYLERQNVVDLQSPDAHTLEILKEIFTRAKNQKHRLTESCLGMLMFNLGCELFFCECNCNNLKIIRQEDIAVFSALLKCLD